MPQGVCVCGGGIILSEPQGGEGKEKTSCSLPDTMPT